MLLLLHTLLLWLLPSGRGMALGLGTWPFPRGSPQNPTPVWSEAEGPARGQQGRRTLPGGSLVPVLRQHMDHYSRTKAIADQLTLMANGTPLPGEYRGALPPPPECMGESGF